MPAWPVRHGLAQRLAASAAKRRDALPTVQRGPVAPIVHRACQWPLWPHGARPGLLCGAPVMAAPYCPRHAPLAHPARDAIGPTAFAAFAEARQAMAAAWCVWIATETPSPAAVTAELDGTTGQLRGLADLAGGAAA